MAHLFITDYKISNDTREQDVERLAFMVAPDLEPLEFVKPNMETLTPPVDEIIRIEMFPIGGFITMTIEEAADLKDSLDKIINVAILTKVTS